MIPVATTFNTWLISTSLKIATARSSLCEESTTFDDMSKVSAFGKITPEASFFFKIYFIGIFIAYSASRILWYEDKSPKLKKIGMLIIPVYGFISLILAFVSLKLYFKENIIESACVIILFSLFFYFLAWISSTSKYS